MSTFDIRNSNTSEITEIVFADTKDKDGDYQAYLIEPSCSTGYICIVDYDKEYITISSKEHAENLIKALHKAIELGWVE